MNSIRLTGLIAATYTPLDGQGQVDHAKIEPMVEHLLEQGISGVYVCGSTGEGMSLTTDERKAVAQSYIDAVGGRVPVVVQVGHNAITDARELARHAQDAGADIVSATCPSYFKVNDVDNLVQCMSQVAGGAPDLPFYYYHIPALTGSAIDMPEFLQAATGPIPNLAGLKYTDTKLFEYQTCLELEQGRFDIVWGCDEMLLGALATGARGAIGSTYNVAAPLYQRLMDAFDEGNLVEARHWQSQSINMIRILCEYPFHAAMKSVLASLGLSVGACRLPQGGLSDSEAAELRERLDSIGFFDWCRRTN